MLTLHSGRADGRREPRRRSRAALAASVGANAVLIGAFFHALTRGYTWADLVRRREAAAPTERLVFVRASGPSAGGARVAARAGGDGTPVIAARPRSAPRLVAPRAVPSVIPPVSRSAPEAGGTGPVVGAGGAGVGSGAGEGISPEYRDPALWIRPGTLATAPKTPKQRVDSVLTQTFGAARDSILAAQELASHQRKPGDWTFKGPGGTWGMDDRSIHLGKIAVPNAVLALLSSKFQQNLRGNPTAALEARRLGDVRRDLLDHAQRSMAEDDFRGAVKEIRARKDRERTVRLAERRRAAELAATQGEPSAGESSPQR